MDTCESCGCTQPAPVHIEKFCAPSDGQVARLGRDCWFVTRLIQESKDLPVLNVPLRHLCLYSAYSEMSLRKFAMHLDAVMAADLSYPIILDEDGELLDGRHRVIKALYERKPTIKVVRFDVNPFPCYTEDD